MSSWICQRVLVKFNYDIFKFFNSLLILEKLLLLRYLKIARWREEKALKILRTTLQIRTENPHIFTNRDPMSPEMQKVFDAL